MSAGRVICLAIWANRGLFVLAVSFVVSGLP
jgi:hypothetical protein